MRRLRKLLIVLLLLYGFMCLAGGVVLAELQLHPWRRALRHEVAFREFTRQAYNADVADVSVTAADGADLRGWFVQPKNANGSMVILLHGVGDNREGVAGFAHIFLDRGYSVLLPDARAHGQSGGMIATYGLKEAGDIHRWVDWLETAHPRCVYGFGESMGASQLLQSLANEQRFCAVVAESAFSRFEQVAPERVAGYSRMPTWFGKSFERPIVDVAILYSRWRYGIDFRRANPADAIAHSRVPVLLIAGTRDHDILPHHSEELARIDPHAQLWMVQGAAHGGAWGANPKAFESKVTEFFADHQSNNP